MSGLKTFFERAATKISETVSSQPKTVDSDFEAKKALFKSFEKDYGFLYRRLQVYFKEVAATAKNWEKVSESTRACFGDQPYDVVENLGRHTEDALKSYEAGWNNLREMMIKYDATIKNMARLISDRDNARVDFDRARTKSEKSGGDPVAEATARATEQVYVEKNHFATESLDYFLETRHDNMASLMGALCRATVTLYSSASDFPSFEVSSPPPPESLVARSPRPAPTPAKSPLLERSSQTPAKSPRLNSLSAASAPARERSASSGGVPGTASGAPVKKVAAAAASPAAASSPMLNRPPGKALPPLQKTVPKQRKVRVMYDFTPADDDTEGLAVAEDEVLVVLEESADGEWLMCASDRGNGFVPKNYTEPSYRPD